MANESENVKRPRLISVQFSHDGLVEMVDINDKDNWNSCVSENLPFSNEDTLPFIDATTKCKGKSTECKVDHKLEVFRDLLWNSLLLRAEHTATRQGDGRALDFFHLEKLGKYHSANKRQGIKYCIKRGHLHPL